MFTEQHRIARSKRFRMARILIFVVTVFVTSSLFAQSDSKSSEPDTEKEHALGDRAGMTQSKMANIIARLAGDYEGELNNIQFTYNGVLMALVSDPANNRMRIIAPVIEADKLTQDHLLATLVSNFHLALDARYALGNGVLYSTYIHPLKELTESQLESAVRQVSSLRTTFGTSYSSGELTFGAQSAEEQEI